ncbi:hypothetical protein E9840_05575 [Tissierella creatinini]|nr:hypothetical protein E9840_05575 [Tissierella creatinini]TJX65297.1 hypothetical protein E8P77_10590 [Soehngenia saccharolytica]
MKRSVIIALIVIIAIFAVGCKKSIEEKISENIIEETVDGEVDLDLDGDTTTIKTEEGSAKIGESLKWPKDKMGKLPELKANITMVMDDANSQLVMVTFEGLDSKDATKYVEAIKALGYVATYETNTSDVVSFSGRHEDGTMLTLMYSNAGDGSISYGKDQSSNDKVNTPAEPPVESEEEVDMTDAATWPSDFFVGIPELKGKITAINSNGSNEKYIDLQYVERQDAIDFIEVLKNSEYKVDTTESTSTDSIEYYAYNEKGDYIFFIYYSNGDSNIGLAKTE